MRKVGPQRIDTCHQKALLSSMAFQELEWHTIDDIDFNGVDNDIPEITHEPGTSVHDNIDPFWKDP